jgi:hypothetical protein
VEEEGGSVHKAKLLAIIEILNPCAVFVADMGGEGHQHLNHEFFPLIRLFSHLGFPTPN